MILYLDTSDNRKTIVRLNEREWIKTYASPRDQDVMGALLEALRVAGSGLQEITAIQVNLGPGSFTGLRVGVSIANALGFSLQVPVNNRPVGDVIEPLYGKLPNISSPRHT